MFSKATHCFGRLKNQVCKPQRSNWKLPSFKTSKTGHCVNIKSQRTEEHIAASPQWGAGRPAPVTAGQVGRSIASLASAQGYHRRFARHGLASWSFVATRTAWTARAACSYLTAVPRQAVPVQIEEGLRMSISISGRDSCGHPRNKGWIGSISVPNCQNGGANLAPYCEEAGVSLILGVLL